MLCARDGTCGQRYRAVLQSLHDGIVVRDERGVVVSVNRRVELLLKMPRDSMIGRQSLSPDVGFLSREGTAIDWHKDYVLSTLRDGERRRILHCVSFGKTAANSGPTQASFRCWATTTLSRTPW